MAISRKMIEDLAFTTKKGKYYVGEEVDAALDTIADEVDALLGELQECRESLARYASQEESVKSFEERLQEQYEDAFLAFQQKLDAKKEELADLEAQVADLRGEKEAIGREIADSLRESIRTQAALLSRWEDPAAVQVEEAPCEPADPEEPPKEDAVPEEAEIRPLPFPDAEEVLGSDVWNDD